VAHECHRTIPTLVRDKAVFPIIDLSYELTGGFAARFIHYKVGRLVARGTILRSDRDDLEQDIKLHLVRRFAHFDPALAHWNTFVVTVVERYILTFLVMRRRRRQLRLASLEQLTRADIESSDDGRTMALGEPESDCEFHDPTSQLDVVLDVQHILARLPEQAQQLCERLMSDSLAEVARQMQVPRTTLYSRILVLRNGFATAFEETRKKASSLRCNSQ
jgi:DNA-directed RNA polymerase specialized sigma24 family protein